MPGTRDKLDRLSAAIRAADTKAVSRAIDARIPFHSRHWFEAIRSGSLEICEMILASGRDPNERLGLRTPLHCAAEHGRMEIAGWLLKNGAGPNNKDFDGRTALDLALDRAIDARFPEIIALLQSAGTASSFWTAVRLGQLEELQAFLEFNPAMANARCDGSGLTPLMVAARCGRLFVLKLLLMHGADTEACSTRFPDESLGGNTALWFGAQGPRTGREELLKILIAHGAEVNAAGEFGWTPLHMAAWWNHPASVRVLLEKGADPAIKDAEGRTALELAMEKESHGALSILAD